VDELRISQTAREPSPGDGVGGGLRLRALELRSFRNYRHYRLDDIGMLTVLVGPNAAGKTSIVEAVQMVTALKSFRTSRYGQLVRLGDEMAVVRAQLVGGGRKMDVSMVVSDGRRSYQLNGKPRTTSGLRGLLPAVAFCPDDLDLAKGSNKARRDALDGLGSQLSKNFHAVRSDYAKLVRQKNRALKEEVPDFYLDSIDEVLVRVGSQLMAHRMVVMEKLRPAFTHLHRDMTAGREHLDFAYVPSWEQRDVDDALQPGESIDDFTLNDERFKKPQVMDVYARALRESRPRERAMGKSVIGPHADKVSFLLDGLNQATYSSQGQQRSIVLAFKLAEAEVIRETLGQKPILLLDDVMSELDASRRQYFMRFISNDMQAIVTTTNREYFDADMQARADVIELEGGR
jgi:DNA replication and repair protein RecF